MGARRMRTAVALPLAALLLSACAQRTTTSDDAAMPAGSWTTVPSAPLAPRLDAVTAWTGAEALVLGGDVDGFCPPNASCAGATESAADGAAYDPEQQTWRLVAEAPYPVPGGTARAVAGDVVHLVHHDRLLSYDASEDAWSVSPPAPEGADLGVPAALDDGTVVVVDGERTAGDRSGQVYDPATRTWSELTGDPLGPTFDRVATAVPGGLVLTGTVLPDDPSTIRPAMRGAVLDLAKREWTVLPENPRTGGWHWSWTGERLVDVSPDGQTADGGRFAQGGVLDPRTREDGALPGAPQMNSGGWPVQASLGPLAAVDGWVYDDRDRTWTRLERPDGAPARPGTAVWAGDELLVLGGMDTDAGWGAEHLSGDAWLWRPTGVDS
jgi:hypothetical protein